MSTVTAGVFLLDLKKENILVCHSTNSSWKSWGIPKGLYDPEDPDFMATALREFKEETSIELKTDDLVFLGESKYKTGNKVLVAYWAVAKDDIDLAKLKCSSMVNEAGKPLFPEVDKYKWLNIKDGGDTLYYPQKILIPKLLLECSK